MATIEIEPPPKFNLTVLLSTISNYNETLKQLTPDYITTYKALEPPILNYTHKLIFKHRTTEISYLLFYPTTINNVIITSGDTHPKYGRQRFATILRALLTTALNKMSTTHWVWTIYTHAINYIIAKAILQYYQPNAIHFIGHSNIITDNSTLRNIPNNVSDQVQFNEFIVYVPANKENNTYAIAILEKGPQFNR